MICLKELLMTFEIIKTNKENNIVSILHLEAKKLYWIKKETYIKFSLTIRICHLKVIKL